MEGLKKQQQRTRQTKAQRGNGLKDEDDDRYEEPADWVGCNGTSEDRGPRDTDGIRGWRSPPSAQAGSALVRCHVVPGWVDEVAMLVETRPRGRGRAKTGHRWR